MNKIIAEKIFKNYLTTKGLIVKTDRLNIKKLDLNEPFTFFVNNTARGTCIYDEKIQRFTLLKCDNRINKNVYTIGDYIRNNKISIKR